MPKTAEANEPPIVFVVFVRPAAMPVWPRGAAAAAAAGSAATRAPEPRPAITMFVMTSPTVVVEREEEQIPGGDEERGDDERDARGVRTRETNENSSAPTIIEIR